MFPTKFGEQELIFPLKINQQIIFSRSMASGQELIYTEVSGTNFPGPKTHDDYFWNSIMRRQRLGRTSAPCVTSFLVSQHSLSQSMDNSER